MWVKWQVLAVGVIVVNLAGPSEAQGLWDKIKQGAETTGEAIGEGVTATGEAIGKGANAVGNTVEKGVNSVGEAISSTDELLSNEETPEATRARLDAMSDEIMAVLLAQNPEADALYHDSAGYAAFDSRKVTVFPVTTGYGRGVAVAKDTGARTYLNMGTGGLGASLGIGGFATQFVILFETPADFERFVVNGYDATAGGGAQVGDDKSADEVRFTQGQSVFVLDKDRWRVNGSLEGTKYWHSPELN
ncbi:hypothetical protein [uncultured Shimia sp.]|uniref:hypothetical protein n=1 Tax=uncultured Shimia sp. TaxID=573152 RepID=UPI0025CFBE2A|nr:hypothetical protein [uncultured Shimia sp.]